MSDVLVDRSGHVATITLNRPETMNAVVPSMLVELSERLVECDADRDVRVVVLTGAGRGFCAGFDFKNIVVGSGAGTFRIEDSPPFVLHRMDTPVVCALNGAAAGYGMDLALGSDLVVAADTAAFSPSVKRSLVAESGGTWLLPRLVGWHKACELMLLGRKLEADELLRLGLVNTVVPLAELASTAQDWAQAIAEQPPLAAQALKRTMRLGLDTTFEANATHVLAEVKGLMSSADFGESVSAFLEKRPPNYQGT